MVRVLSVLALAAVVLAVPAADAQASSAQRFADAVLRGKVALRAVKPEVDRRYAALEEDFKRCERLPVPNPPSKRFARRLEILVALAMSGTIYRPSQPVLDRIVSDLDAIPTRDPALRSGRAAWRKFAARLRGMAVVERPCELMQQWAATGYAPTSEPGPPHEQAARFFDGLEDERVRTKLQRAVRRMRALGVSPDDAERFKGDRLFDDVGPEGFDGE